MKTNFINKLKIIIILVTISINIFFSFYVQSFANTKLADSDTTTSTSDNKIQNLSIYSDAAILMDSKTGKILYEKNSNEKKYPASTTKILTAIIAIENCNLSDTISASYNAIMSIPSGYSIAEIKENEVLTVEQLLNVFLIHSANEAGYILAEHISGSISNFADLMNQKALEIGCTDTHFTNPSGIQDENHYSTAHDMALIAQYCMKNETFRQIVCKTSYTLEPTDKTPEERYFVTTNDLIKTSSEYYYPYCIGIKTGYTSKAKNCLISASQKDGLELITVVLGAEFTENGKSARNTDTINLFNYGFENYKYQEILSKNSVIKNVTVKNATKETKELPIITENSITSLLPNNIDFNSLEPIISINENIEAPISEGTVIGSIKYNIDGIEYSTNLCAEHSVEKFDLILLIGQISAVIIILIIIYKILSHKSNIKYKKKTSKKKGKHSKRQKDAIYKF